MNTFMHIARTTANLTKAALAERVGVSREYITMIEAGYRTPSLPVAVRICEELPGLEISQLLPPAETNSATDTNYTAKVTRNSATDTLDEGDAA